VTKGPNPRRAAEEVEQLFADLWQVFPFSALRRGFRPQVDVYRTEDPPELTVVVELAGVDPDTVRLDATGNGLVIAGERPWPNVEGQVYRQMEIDYGPFERHVSLEDSVDVAHAEATYGRGLLTVRLPLAAARTPAERIEIEVRRP
jgi:HSP20 family protein